MLPRARPGQVGGGEPCARQAAEGGAGRGYGVGLGRLRRARCMGYFFTTHSSHSSPPRACERHIVVVCWGFEIPGPFPPVRNPQLAALKCSYRSDRVTRD